MQVVLLNMSAEDIPELEPLFRSALLKLQNCSALLDPLPPGESLSITMHNVCTNARGSGAGCPF